MFDFYRKVPTDLVQGSAAGGVLSLCAVAMMALVLADHKLLHRAQCG